jgi:glycosyltransferase involved in cell wall biosynthesis
MVSWVLPFQNYDLLIGYERQCLKSFKRAKRDGKITLLDLASIHAQKQREINKQYNNILTGFKPSSLLDTEKEVKAEELEYADYIITLSEFAKNSCIEAGIQKERIFTVQLGIDMDAFEPKKSYDTEVFEILLVAGMRHWKGIVDLIETFERLALPNAVLTLVGGSGDALEYVEEHVSEHVRYIPFLHHDELKKMYRKASVFVLPSYMDSWAQVVCEAMACGTPVIVSENTGAKDIVQSGENGFVVELADREQLSEKITYFYNHREEVERMGKNARCSVEHLTWENYYRQIDKIMKMIESGNV